MAKGRVDLENNKNIVYLSCIECCIQCNIHNVFIVFQIYSSLFPIDKEAIDLDSHI